MPPESTSKSPGPRNGGGERSANNALPPGMRDLLPAEARFQTQVGREVMASFDAFGFERVWLPTFEFAEVLARSHGLEGAALKFIEPETGEVVALRSDMTPQIARVVATRFGTAPRPLRLCYQGSVVRRRKERARTESQVVQAGAELIGRGGAEGDFEVIETLCSAVRAAHLEDFVLDLGHCGIAASLMQRVSPETAAELTDALAAKDITALELAGRRAGLDKTSLGALARLPELHGGDEVWGKAEPHLRGTDAEGPFRDLHALYRRASASGFAPSVIVDLGETRAVDYYTGPVFQLLAHGPGEPIASGGRYDALYDRFGAPSPAAGFAIDLNHLCWALRSAGRTAIMQPHVAVGPFVSWKLKELLRARGVACAEAPSPAEYASYWKYEFALEGGEKLRLSHLPTNRQREFAEVDGDAVAQEIANFIHEVACASG